MTVKTDFAAARLSFPAVLVFPGGGMPPGRISVSLSQNIENEWPGVLLCQVIVRPKGSERKMMGYMNWLLNVFPEAPNLPQIIGSPASR
jgi:hypothetical protein